MSDLPLDEKQEMNNGTSQEISIIKHTSNADLTKAGHTVKAVLDVKLSRAKERHASAMGFSSSHHLLAALKDAPVEKHFDDYIEVLKVQALEKHQVKLSENSIEQLRRELCD